MERDIIHIDEELCDGCGSCVSACAEGAIKLVDGKARVIREEYCDGLGVCVGECHTGALEVVRREAVPFDQSLVDLHLAATGRDPEPPVPAAGGAPLGHGETPCCPGSQVRRQQARPGGEPAVGGGGLPGQVNPSELAHWPVQLHLVPPRAPFFAGKELVVLSTCAPVASADVHWRFLRGRAVVVACPKLDRTDPYVEKLAAILSSNDIPRVLVVRMEVPCCGGLTRLVGMAHELSGGLTPVHEVVVSTDGRVLGERPLMVP